MHFRYVPQFSSYMFAYTFTDLGLCVCTEGWAGSDCSSISDSDSLVWETLLDTQLSAVRLTLSFKTIGMSLCSYRLSVFGFISSHRIRHIGSSGGWVTP